MIGTLGWAILEGERGCWTRMHDHLVSRGISHEKSDELILKLYEARWGGPSAFTRVCVEIEGYSL